MKKAEAFVRSFRSIIAPAKSCEAPPDANPDTTIFDKAKTDFSLGALGVNGCDLHNAYRLGLVQIGHLVLVTRRGDFEGGRNSKTLAFVGPGEPFINPENGRPRHIFFDRYYNNGQSLVTIEDIINWELISGKLTTDETKRLGKALLNRGNEAARRKMHQKNNQRTSSGTIFPH